MRVFIKYLSRAIHFCWRALEFNFDSALENIHERWAGMTVSGPARTGRDSNLSDGKDQVAASVRMQVLLQQFFRLERFLRLDGRRCRRGEQQENGHPFVPSFP